MVNVSLAGTKKRKNASAGANDDDLPGGLQIPTGAPSDSVAREVSDRIAPHARGISEPIPAQQDIQKMLARKPKAVELTDAERHRILRDTMARLASGDDARVSLIGYEESEPEQPAARKHRSSRKSLNPLRSADVSDDEVDDQDAQPADEPPLGSSAACITDDDDDGVENPPAVQIQRSSGGRSRRTTIDLDSENDGHPKRHLLED
jgi:hypothetical protein